LFNDIKEGLKKIFCSRLTVVVILFAVLIIITVRRLFYLQIIEGDVYADNFISQFSKERNIKSTRGNIYDRNGNILAYNKLVYTMTIEDNGIYDTTREKQLTLNGTAYQIIQLVKKNNESIIHDFPVVLDEGGNFAFDLEGTGLMRFRADVYGIAEIDKMTEDQADSSADDIIEFLSGENKFAIYNEYTEEELIRYNLPMTFTKKEKLDIITIRYMLSVNWYTKYVPITIATDISDETVANIMENKSRLQGVDVKEDCIRVYEDGEYFANIIGYTGKISMEELEKMQKLNSNYTNASIIGKVGIEKNMDTSLQGTDGIEHIFVNNLGITIEVDRDSEIKPEAGNNVYLTIDKDMQIATYKILEQRIAGILIANISPVINFNKSSVSDASKIKIPIGDVYFALINNNIIDTTRFSEADGSVTEKNMYHKFQQKQKDVLDSITKELTNNPKRYKDSSAEMQKYLSYVVNEVLIRKTGILRLENIDKTDKTFIAWTIDENISLKEYLTYAITKLDWVDFSKIKAGSTYMDSAELYQALVDEIINYLKSDINFNKIYFKYMIQDGVISGNDICILLFDQSVLTKDDSDYSELIKGELSPYQFMINKIYKLEITPAQLALDPCSGSAVITDPKKGEVLACVSYPGYDNNRLANQMDTTYYNQLYNDLSVPFYNKATQQLTAPGSTFKLITVVAGLEDQVITPDTIISCDGVFTKVEPSLRCWKTQGHGDLSLIEGIKNSCNVYFNEVAYRLGTDSNGEFSDSLALHKLQTYAELFDLDKKSGIELVESVPKVTDQYAIPSSIGQGTHNYTTSQLARYVTTIANRGTSYKLSILDKVTDSSGNLITDFSPEIQSNVELPEIVWNNLQIGMRQVVENNATFQKLKISAAGKTGTAQQVKSRPSHGLYIGYAPYVDPQIAMAIRIANGYTSSNAAGVAKDIINYYFKLLSKSEILSGTASKASNNAHED